MAGAVLHVCVFTRVEGDAGQPAATAALLAAACSAAYFDDTAVVVVADVDDFEFLLKRR